MGNVQIPQDPAAAGQPATPPFKFNLRQPLQIIASGESGECIARSEHASAEPQYLLRHKAADGRAIEAWWTEEALSATVDLVALGRQQAAVENKFDGWISGRLALLGDEVVQRAETRHDKISPVGFVAQWLDGMTSLPVTPCTAEQLYRAFRRWCDYVEFRIPPNQAAFSFQVRNAQTSRPLLYEICDTDPLGIHRKVRVWLLGDQSTAPEELPTRLAEFERALEIYCHTAV